MLKFHRKTRAQKKDSSSKKNIFRRMLKSGTLLLASTIITTALLFGGMEIALRQIRPDIQNLVDRHYHYEKSRIFRNGAYTISKNIHLENKTEYISIHNGLTLRQHRDFTLSKGENTMRIAAMGDSFLENIRMEVQYGVSEVLDYLLNYATIPNGRKFEILNYGIENYATEQIYLFYRDEARAMDPDIIIYFYCQNDLEDMMINKLLTLDKKGNLVHCPSKERGFVKTQLSKLYTTYYVLEAMKKLQAFWNTKYGTSFFDYYKKWDYEKVEGERVQHYKESRKDKSKIIDHRNSDAVKLFTVIMDKMIAQIKADGDKFYVVTTPYAVDDRYGDEHNAFIRQFFEEWGVQVIDLWPIFRDYKGPRKLRFANDDHWNEEGNAFASEYLLKYLSNELGIEIFGQENIHKKLSQYYKAFPSNSLKEVSLKFFDPNIDCSEELKREIRERYIPLQLKYEKEGKLPAPPTIKNYDYIRHW
ncbi:MAG: SGNH/GDSL hydrolase family protein [Candidatus Micrarchaeia archaeon]